MCLFREFFAFILRYTLAQPTICIKHHNCCTPGYFSDIQWVIHEYSYYLLIPEHIHVLLLAQCRAQVIKPRYFKISCKRSIIIVGGRVDYRPCDPCNTYSSRYHWTSAPLLQNLTQIVH
jgi:hypothetical protein